MVVAEELGEVVQEDQETPQCALVQNLDTVCVMYLHYCYISVHYYSSNERVVMYTEIGVSSDLTRWKCYIISLASPDSFNINFTSFLMISSAFLRKG